MHNLQLLIPQRRLASLLLYQPLFKQYKCKKNREYIYTQDTKQTEARFSAVLHKIGLQYKIYFIYKIKRPAYAIRQLRLTEIFCMRLLFSSNYVTKLRSQISELQIFPQVEKNNLAKYHFSRPLSGVVHYALHKSYQQLSQIPQRALRSCANGPPNKT